MNIEIGTDIVENERLKDASLDFIKMILTPREFEYTIRKKRNSSFLPVVLQLKKPYLKL